jgi:PAS domain S-box-containing protein
VLVIDSDGVIEYANAAAHALIGHSGDDLAGQTLWRLVPGLRPSLGTVMGGSGPGAALPVVSREFELVYPEARSVRLYMVPFRGSEEGGAHRFVVILADITGEKEAAGRRLEDERTSSVLLLAAGVAHELGNPLNSITIHLQLIARRLQRIKASRDAEGIAESISICRDEVQRLDGIIRNFLEAISPRPPTLSETNLAAVLAEVLRVHAREFADRGVGIEAETHASLPPVMADRDQLKQVFFNITKNALEAMEPGGKLRIRSRADDDSVFLLFGDTGSGIKQEDFARLFQPYYTTKPGGHGLGLMIVRRIMRDHGGQVGIESKAGAGTLVTLQFPRKDRRVRMLESGEPG